jgi:hypothetical protein
MTDVYNVNGIYPTPQTTTTNPFPNPPATVTISQTEYTSLVAANELLYAVRSLLDNLDLAEAWAAIEAIVPQAS